MTKEEIKKNSTLVAVKNTTQNAPLERLLTHLRTRKILPFIKGANVLDFGCGAYLRTLRIIGKLTAARYGIDSVFASTGSHRTPDGIGVAASFQDLANMLNSDEVKINCIVSLACFEHLEYEQCRGVLRELSRLSAPQAILVGTVPTPAAKPVLEFISYKLRLIDRSQIEDHKVYYDRDSFVRMIHGTGWALTQYKRFQLGMNSFFKLEKKPLQYQIKSMDRS